MTVRVAINGFGRIGRNVLRAIAEAEPQGHRGRRHQRSRSGGNQRPSAALRQRARPLPRRGHGQGRHHQRRQRRHQGHRRSSDPSKLPWKDLGVDIALECTGIFTAKDKASAHLTAGAKRVLVSAPADGADLTVVYGVNHDKLTKDHKVVSNASCTTNCLAPVAKVLNDAVGIDKGFMTTIHSYTGDQPTLDTMHKDLYRARAAALYMIPTSTGAAKAVGLVLPELNGKLDGVSIRVPTPNVSVIDFKFVAKKATSKDEVNGAIKRAAEQQLKGILGYTDAAERLDRLQPRPALLDLPHGPDQGDGRHLRARDVVVRQRMGLLQPHGGHRRGDGQADLTPRAERAMSAFRTLDHADVKGKRVLVRADLNVPVENGVVTDATRIERMAHAITEIADKGAKVILLSHFGRPKGRDQKNSLKPVAAEVAHIIKRPVKFVDDCIGEGAERAVAAMKNGDIVCLENTRFYPGEEKNDPAFVAALAKLGDIFVNDAFSVSHRAHASTEGLAHVLPAYAGRTLQAELEAFEKVLDKPARPLAAIVGGAKISTKLDLLGHLLQKVDVLIIGGAMANTFLLAQGKKVGKSPGRARSRRHRAEDHGRGQSRQARDRAAGRRGGGGKIRGAMRLRAWSISTMSATRT